MNGLESLQGRHLFHNDLTPRGYVGTNRMPVLRGAYARGVKS
jgi:hypothetical protein